MLGPNWHGETEMMKMVLELKSLISNSQSCKIKEHNPAFIVTLPSKWPLPAMISRCGGLRMQPGKYNEHSNFRSKVRTSWPELSIISMVKARDGPQS